MVETSSTEEPAYIPPDTRITEMNVRQGREGLQTTIGITTICPYYINVRGVRPKLGKFHFLKGFLNEEVFLLSEPKVKGYLW